MERTTAPNARVDLFGAGKPGYHYNDDIPGMDPTYNSPDAMNAFQEEICRVIEGAGIALDGADLGQLFKAVKLLSGNRSRSQSIINASTALTAANACGIVIGNAGTGITATLMAAADVSVGDRVAFFNKGAGNMTVACAGADTITVNTTTVTSLVVGPGDSLVLESDAAGTFFAVSGSVLISYASAFAASFGTSGYQMLPSGLLQQWGYHSSTGSSGSITFPTTFPNSCLNVSATIAQTSSGRMVGVNTLSTTGFSFFTSAPGGSSAEPFYWNALGH